LNIALDLFIDKGFDKASLRDIAGQLGFSKAAIYYHFASKEEILLALHLRLHELGRAALARFDQQPAGPQAWREILQDLVGEMLANRKLFIVHERNRAAFEFLHAQKQHGASHDDIESQLRRAMSDPSVPVRERVRLACAIGALMGGLIMTGGAFADVPTEQLADMFREAVGDLLDEPGVRTAASRPNWKRQKI
jgi:AcrR family transcriptional regulator